MNQLLFSTRNLNPQLKRFIAASAFVGMLSMLMIPAVFAQTLPPLQDNSGSYTTYGNGYDNSGYNNNSNYGGQTYQQPNNYGSYNNNYGGYNAPQLQGRVSSAPAGTVMMATANQTMTSEYARVGDRFQAVLGTAITGQDGSLILPSGSQLEGQVVMATPAGRAGKSGVLDIRFTSATLPNGQRVPLSAKIQTEDGTGLIKGDSTKMRVGKAAGRAALGAGLGAALGTAMGPLSGGSVGKGAIYGTAIGGGLGLANAAWKKGDDAVLPSGEPINIVLDQPLTVSPSSNPMPANYNTGGYNNSGYGNSGYGTGGYNNYGNTNTTPNTNYGNTGGYSNYGY